MANIIAVKDPIYFSDGVNISCQIQLDGSTDWLDFLATPDDVEVHGKELYADLIAGVYGAIAPYVATTQYKTKFDSLDFIDLFTEAEQLAIVSATMQSAAVKRLYDKMLGANYVSLDDERTIAGLDALVSAGLITAVRKTKILTPQLVQP